MLIFFLEVVPLGRMVNVRRVYCDNDQRIILAAHLRKTKPNVLSDGVTKKVAVQFMVPLRVVQRVWFDHLQGIENVCNKKPLNCWCKRFEVDPEAIMQVPPYKRTTLKDLAHELNMSISTLHMRFKEKEFRRKCHQTLYDNDQFCITISSYQIFHYMILILSNPHGNSTSHCHEDICSNDECQT
jgi:AraC-like DNA-binding protein